ncbi:hypothetical protein GCM10027415_37710 [Humibacter ginsengisoli]
MTSFRARVEKSSIGTSGGQAARRTVSTSTASKVMARAATIGKTTSKSAQTREQKK